MQLINWTAKKERGQPSSFYWFCNTSLAEPLLTLLKKSVHDGVFLDKWKIANVTTVFKS